MVNLQQKKLIRLLADPHAWRHSDIRRARDAANLEREVKAMNVSSIAAMLKEFARCITS